MAASQVMPSVHAFTDTVSQAAWKTKPSWALVATSDRTVNPDLERFMSTQANAAHGPAIRCAVMLWLIRLNLERQA